MSLKTKMSKYLISCQELMKQDTQNDMKLQIRMQVFVIINNAGKKINVDENVKD